MIICRGADFSFEKRNQSGYKPVFMKETDIDRLSEKMSMLFLNALVNIPEEDLTYFLADLPEGWWNQTVRKIQNTEVMTVN